MVRKFFEKLESLGEWGGTKRDIAFLILGGLSLAVSLLNGHAITLPFEAAWVAIVLCGTPILIDAVTGLALRFDIKADVLVAMALIASLAIGEYFAAGEVAFIMQLGAFLEDWTVSRSRKGMERLIKLTPTTARVIRDGKTIEIPASEVLCDDICRVVPGETIPVDGIITEGDTSIDQAALTGESIPVDKSVGDEVMSGTVNRFGAFEMRATKVGEDSSIQRMVRLVKSADAGKAKIVGIADRMATWVVVTALLAAGLTWFFTGEIIRAVTILVVFCPCALVLATPTAIIAAIGNLTHHGILVKEGDALERLSKINKIAFDKTGTLTLGKPQVVKVYGSDMFYAMVASAESRSEHPLGKAIVEGFTKTGSKILSVENFKMFPGKGISADVSGKLVFAGSIDFIKESAQKNNLNFASQESQVLHEAESYRDQGATVVFAMAGETLGFIALQDTLRENAPSVCGDIADFGVTPVLLSGDHLSAVAYTANKLHIQEFNANQSPEDKMRFVNGATDGEPKNKIAMIGDGINDAPALKAAFVGIAMGGIGSDIAVEAADMALVRDDIDEIPHLLRLSRKMMRTIKQNIAFSMTLNFVAIALAIAGILNPVVGALVHNAGSVIVIVNSAMLLKWRKRTLHKP